MILKSGNPRVLVTREQSKKNDRAEKSTIVEQFSVKISVQVVHDKLKFWEVSKGGTLVTHISRALFNIHIAMPLW